jgi:hypothetical protein
MPTMKINVNLIVIVVDFPLCAMHHPPGDGWYIVQRSLDLTIVGTLDRIDQGRDPGGERDEEEEEEEDYYGRRGSENTGQKRQQQRRLQIQWLVRL